MDGTHEQWLGYQFGCTMYSQHSHVSNQCVANGALHGDYCIGMLSQQNEGMNIESGYHAWAATIHQCLKGSAQMQWWRRHMAALSFVICSGTERIVNHIAPPLAKVI